MTTHGHYQQVKKAEHLSHQDKIGACLTCRYWKAKGERMEPHNQLVALCVQPELALFELIVSGSSACNRWEKADSVSKNAELYSKRYESE